MPQQPTEFTVELQPRARFDAIDVRSRILAVHGDVLAEFPRAYFVSLHTTAGYLEQGLASRLAKKGEDGVDLYMDAFRLVFPEDAGYEHDKLELRTELSESQRAVEPRNADSHLAFMASGLRACVSYRATGEPVWFVDLDGVNAGQPRRRQTTVMAYTHEVPVWKTRFTIPVSGHPMDSVNLRDPKIGFYDMLEEAIARYGVAKGRHAWADPRSIPAKTLDYAKYDVVRALNKLVDALGLNESVIERAMARAMAVPAERFLRFKRTVNLLVSDGPTPGRGGIVQGVYQSPILVQWDHASNQSRTVDVTLARII